MSGISRAQALDCFASHDLIGIGMEADAVRRRLHPENVVSYALEGTIDCAGKDVETVLAQVEEVVDLGGTGALLTGGAGPELFAEIRSCFPGFQIKVAASDVEALAKSAGITMRDTLQRLRDAGVVSLHGSAELKVYRAVHEAGLGVTAELAIDAGDSNSERVEALFAIAALQAETNGLVAFRLSSAESRRELDDPTAVEYLKTLAIARMVLSNVEHIQVNWRQQGMKVMQMSLRFGANDVGPVLGTSEQQVRQIIRDAGFKPVERDALHGTMMLA